MATDVIQSAYRRAWWGLVLRGLLALTLGAFILLRPIDSIASFGLVIAIWALVNGIAQIVHAVQLREVFRQWWVLLLSGILSALFGIAALYYYPGLSLAFAVAWVAWWLFLSGGLAIYAGVIEKRIGVEWGWTFALGILSVLAGVFALMSPPTTLAAIMGLIAGFAIVAGVVMLIGAFRLTSAKQEISSAIHSARA
jgi:uncharacterized membrane protein HdeD (DUF308 family)